MNKPTRIIPLAAAIIASSIVLRPSGEAVTEEKKLLAPPPAAVASSSETVKLRDLIIDADTQNRVSIDQDLVNHYKELIKEARKAEQPIPFPALFVVRSKEGKLYLWDGFHRLDALKASKEAEFDVDIYDVPENWDAVKYAQLLALGANSAHGKQRTNKDIQRAVKNALSDPDFSAWSNTVIANWVGVSEATIRNHRSAVGSPSVRLAKRGGKTVSVETKNIGKKGGKKAKPAKKAKGKPEPEGAKPEKGEKLDEALTNAIKKISDAIEPASLAGQVRKGLEDGSIDLPRAEIVAWATTSKDRINHIVKLVVDLQMKPTRAFAFLDKEVTGATNMDSVAMLLLTKQKRKEVIGSLELVFAGDGTLSGRLIKKS